MEINDGINEKKLVIRIVSLIFFVFIIHSLAMKFYWYFSIWYFDMPMHILGGFWIGLAIIWLFKIKDLSRDTIAKIILGFLLIALFWEVFEFSVDKTITQNPFNVLDTISDICFGFAGAFISILYFSKRIMIKKNFKI